MDGLYRLRYGKRHGTCAGAVRVERWGKSSPDGAEVSIAVNSIRSNTGMGTLAGPAVPGVA